MLLNDKKERTNLRKDDIIVFNHVNQTLKVFRFTENSVLGDYSGQLFFETVSLTKEGSVINGENESLKGDGVGISVRDFLEIILCITNLMIKPTKEITSNHYTLEKNDHFWVLAEYPEDENHG